MPPKIKITEDEVIQAALNIVRQQGTGALNARNVALALGCSTQPVFSNFATMMELRLAVVAEADKICNKYIDREIQTGEFPAYKASGMAYIRFAKEEKELFKLLYMRNRTNESDDTQPGVSDQMSKIVQEHTGLDGIQAELFHLEMWAFVHGVASMFATGFLDLDRELVSKMLTDAYQGLRKQYGME